MDIYSCGGETMEKYLVFYNKIDNKELSRYTIEGTFEGERDATTELLAYENNIDVEDIITKIEMR